MLKGENIKVGDILTVRSWKDLAEYCNESLNKYALYPTEKEDDPRCCVNNEMGSYCGRKLTVERVYRYNGCVALRMKECRWSWRPWMFEEFAYEHAAIEIADIEQEYEIEFLLGDD